MRSIALAGLALLTLAACHRHDDAATPTASAAPPTATASNTPATPPPPTRPERRAGLWEIHQSADGLEGVQTTQLCLDKASEQRLSAFSAQANVAHCSSKDVTRMDGGAWSFHSVCDLRSGGQATSSGTITGDLTSSYVVQATTTTTGAGAPQENGEHHINITARWVGECKPGQKGGDMILPNGVRINLVGG